MKKAYFSKPVSSVNNDDPKALNNSDDYDDALLDDPEDDYLCSQAFDLGDGQTSTPVFRPTIQPPMVINQFRPPMTPQSRPVVTQFRSSTPLSRPIVPRFQSPLVNPRFQPRPSIDPITTTTTSNPQSRFGPVSAPQFQRPSNPLPPPQPTPQPGPATFNTSFVQQIEKPPDAKYDQLSGENSWLKDRLQNIQKQLEEEREAKQKMLEEKEAELAEFKKLSEKKLNNIQATLEFTEVDFTGSKMKINELERQLRDCKARLETQTLTRPLPYSLPIVMHRALDFSPNKGFVDWDKRVTLDDVPDIKS